VEVVEGEREGKEEGGKGEGASGVLWGARCRRAVSLLLLLMLLLVLAARALQAVMAVVVMVVMVAAAAVVVVVVVVVVVIVAETAMEIRGWLRKRRTVRPRGWIRTRGRSNLSVLNCAAHCFIRDGSGGMARERDYGAICIYI